MKMNVNNGCACAGVSVCVSVWMGLCVCVVELMSECEAFESLCVFESFI